MKEKMLDEWRSPLTPIYKNKGDSQSCTSHRTIKHTLKIWERVVETKVRLLVGMSKQ